MEVEDNNRNLKSYLVYAIVFVVMLIILTVGATYAFFRVNTTSFATSSNISSSMECLNISYSETGTIDLDYQYPVTDTYALANLTPITITVTNNCSGNGQSVNYSLVLTSLSQSSGYIPDNKMRVNVKRQIGNNSETTLINTGYLSSLTQLSSGNAYNFLINDLATRNETSSYTNKTMYSIDSNSVASGGTNIYKIYLWIDYWEGDTTQTGLYDNSTQNMDYKADVSLITNP